MSSELLRAKIENQIRSDYNLSPEDIFTNKQLKAFNNRLNATSESLMWDEVAARVGNSSSGVGEVSLINSEFSKSGNGKFTVVTDASKIRITPDMVMHGLRNANLEVPMETQEALQTTLTEAQSAGKYSGSSMVRNAFRIGGRILTVVGATADAYRILTAEDKWHTASEVAGGWAGGMAAATAFSAWFLPADTAGPFLWIAHGIGALTAFAIGYTKGSEITN